MGGSDTDQAQETAAGDELVVVFAKEPRPGLAKTRLAADVGRERARELCEAFVLDTLDAARASGARVLVAHAPADAAGWFGEKAPWAELWAQPEIEFGERLVAAVAEAARRGAKRVAMIGMDTPHLPPARLREAFEGLADADVCLGAAADGGYYLIALDRSRPELFRDIPWSSPETLAATVARCDQLGLRTRLLAEELDVDDGPSLDALRVTLAERPGAAPRTRALLAE